MNIRDPMLPLSLVAFRALQDEVSRLDNERNRIAAKLEADAATMRHTQGCKGARDPHREAKARYAEVIAKLLREGRF